MRRFFKVKNFFLISFLAVAGIFSAGAFALNKQVKETPIIENALAQSSSDQDATHVFVTDYHRNEWSGKGDIHARISGVVFDSEAAYNHVNQLSQADFPVVSDYVSGGNDGVLIAKMSYDSENASENWKKFHIVLPWFIQECYIQFYAGSDENYVNYQEGGARFEIHCYRKYNYWINFKGNCSWASGAHANFYVATIEQGTVAGDNNKYKYSQPLYHVIYNTNGGSTITADDFKRGVKINQTTPTKDGYHFVGWYKESTFENAFSKDDPVKSDLNLYAKWDQNVVLRWYADNASHSSYLYSYVWIPSGAGDTWPGTKDDKTTLKTVTNGNYYERVIDTFTPTRAIFNTGQGGSQTDDLTINTDYYDGSYYYNLEEESWLKYELTVTYKDVGNTAFSGTHGASYPTVHYYGASDTLDTPTKPGYTFSGYFTDSSGTGSSVSSLSANDYTDDIVLYAKWTAASYAVSFNNGGGTGGSISASSYTYKPSGTSTITVTAPTKGGYSPSYTITRTGIYGGSAPTVSGSTITIPAGSYGTFTIGTTWNGNSYDVTFDNGGGSGGSISRTSYSTSGSSQTITVTAPTKTGYKNPTYSVTRTGTYGGSAPTVSGSTITIPANSYGTFTINTAWSPNTDTPYTVKHYKQNLDGTYPSSPTDTDNLTGTTGASVTPARKNYEGFTAPAGQTVTILANGSRVVTYQYTRNSYTLTWDGNGGTVTGGTSGSVKYGATITQPNSVTREGYTFTGWNTTPAATMPAANTTYIAQWSINSYNLTLTVGSGIANIYYKINGAVNYTSITSTTTVTVTYNSTFYLYATAKDGYILNSPFSGYTSDSPYSAAMPASAQTWTPTFTSGLGAAQVFAQGFNDSIGEACTYAGGTPKSDLAGPWATQATAYGGLADYVTYWLDLEHSSDSDIVEFIGKYNYVYGKYGTEYELADFMGTGGKSASAINNFNPYSLISEGEDNSSTIIIVIATSVSLLSITALSVLLVKKRKAKQD